jgi:hypothetical protein
LAHELNIGFRSGVTLYAFIARPSDGYVLDVTQNQWHSPGVALASDCQVALVQQGATQFYSGDLPALVAGTYDAMFRLRRGNAAAWNDPELASQMLTWDGAHEVFPSDNKAELDAIKAELDTIKFEIEALGVAEITLTSPMTAGGDVVIYGGTAYGPTTALRIQWALTGVHDLTGATLLLFDNWDALLPGTLSVLNPGANQTQTIDLQLLPEESQWFKDNGPTTNLRVVAELANGGIETIIDCDLTAR